MSNLNDLDRPPSKRSKLPSTSTSNNTTTTIKLKRREGLFAPFRSLGYVSTSVPFIIQSKSSKYLESPSITIITSLGNSWAMWEGSTLKLLFIGPDMNAPITSLACSVDSIFAAASNFVGRYVRGKEVGRMVLNVPTSLTSSSSSSQGVDDEESDSGEEFNTGKSNSGSEILTDLIIFGTSLLALSSNGKKMFVWDIPTLVNPAASSTSSLNIPQTTPYATIDFPYGFTASKIVHPASYLNKVVVGSKEGALAVWNIRTGSLIHTFLPEVLSNSPASITALTQSPAIDVLGVGYSNGHCVLFDVRLGEVLGQVRLEGEGGGEVTGVSFRNDEISQTLAVSSSTGHVALFDLAAKLRLLHLVRAAHASSVGGLHWLPGQPLMMTSGEDNSLKQWLFDSPSAAPRLLRQRSGHHAPPHLVRYYGDEGKAILTAGGDRAVRYTSIVRDSRGYELSQGSIAKKATSLGVAPDSLKLPVIKSMSFSTSRSKDWDDVVTVSEGESLGRTWSVENKRVGKWTLSGESSMQTSCVSACGNFGLIGSTDGQVILYNMQSGMRRKNFVVPNGGISDIKGQHITGIVTDALNRVVIVSTLKGGLHFFDFQTMKLVLSMSVPASVTSISLHRENGLLAVTCDDLIVRVVDIETRRVVRELIGFRGTILDLAFSPDSRWIIVTSQDSIIRTFDVPTGQLVDAFRTSSVATSLSFSPTSDFLATSHVDSVGIYLWANRAQFSEISLKSFNEADLEEVALPTLQGSLEDNDLSAMSIPAGWNDIQPYTTPDQLSEDLLTLSLMLRSRWQTLLNLETIKRRNKPKEVLKAPERAPFFLPTLPGVNQRFDLGTDKVAQLQNVTKSQRLGAGATTIDTDFVRRMMQENTTGDYQAFFEYLKALSPSAIDLELRSLSTLPHLITFLLTLSTRLESFKDFEAVQTFLACFLKIQGDILVQNTEVQEALMKVLKAQIEGAERLGELTNYSIGTLSFLRNVAVA